MAVTAKELVNTYKKDPATAKEHIRFLADRFKMIDQS